jgi:hypothetical protein
MNGKGIDGILDQLGLPRGTGDGVARLIQDHLADAGALVRLAAGPPRPIGELLVEAGRLDAAGLRGVLEEQAVTGERFGEVLVRHGDLSPQERDIALEFQRHQRERDASEGSLRLGTILLARGDVTPEQLEAALVRQRGSGRKLGEELVAAGDVDESRLAEVLSLQGKLVAVALAAALALAPVGASAASAGSPLSANARTDFAIKIPAVLRLQSTFQAEHVTIEQRDVNRGYVEVASASRFELVANIPYDVNFESNAAWFSSVKVSGFPNEVQFGAGGGRYFQPLKRVDRGPRELNYRFELDPTTLPGTYRWPLSLSVSAI